MVSEHYNLQFYRPAVFTCTCTILIHTSILCQFSLSLKFIFGIIIFHFSLRSFTYCIAGPQTMFNMFIQVQFFVCLVKNVDSLILSCEFPLWMQWASMAYGFSLIFLFSNFYIKSYINSKPHHKSKQVSNARKHRHS